MMDESRGGVKRERGEGERGKDCYFHFQLYKL